MSNNIYKGIFTLRFLLFTTLIIIVMIILGCFYGETHWYPWIVSITASVVASVLVGAYYEFVQKEQISEEHLKIMEYLNEKNRSGILKYYGSFDESVKDISDEAAESKKIDIYLTYGYTILNNLSSKISYALSKKDSEVNIYIMGPKNPFLTSYSEHWYNSDKTEKLEQKIEETIRLLKGKYTDLTKNKSLNGKLNVYLNQNSPVNYSFYLFEDKLFFVPSKNTKSKEYYPICILAQKTSEEKSLFNKVADELKRLKEDNCFENLNLKDE